MDALWNGEPVKLTKCGGDMLMPFYRRYDSTSKRVLDELKFMYRLLWKALVKRIGIVEIARNQRISKKDSRVMIKRRANLSKGPDSVVRASTNRGDVVCQRKVRVEGHTKIASSRGGMKLATRKN